MSVTVITAIFGDYDEIPVIPPGFDEAILVSDHPIESEWTNVIHNVPIPPRLLGKIPKFRPDLFTNTKKSVWIDAGIDFKTNWLIEQAIEPLFENQIKLFRHPVRNCIYDEAEFCREIAKYKNWPMAKQVENYLSQGMPRNFGLWAGGVIVRNNNNYMKEFGDKWLVENVSWSIQDQLSLPYLAWKNQVSIKEFPVDFNDAPLELRYHKENTAIGSGFRVDMDWQSLSEEVANLNSTIKTLEKDLERIRNTNSFAFKPNRVKKYFQNALNKTQINK